jgi:hypothetical protein
MPYNYPNYNAWNYREPDAYFSDDSDGGEYPTDPDDTDSDDEVDMRHGDYREHANGDSFELEDYFEEEDDDSERPAYDWEHRRAEPEVEEESEELDAFYWVGGVRLQSRWDNNVNIEGRTWLCGMTQKTSSITILITLCNAETGRKIRAGAWRCWE